MRLCLSPSLTRVCSAAVLLALMGLGFAVLILDPDLTPTSIAQLLAAARADVFISSSNTTTHPVCGVRHLPLKDWARLGVQLRRGRFSARETRKSLSLPPPLYPPQEPALYLHTSSVCCLPD